MLLCNLSYPSWSGYYLTNQFIKFGMHNRTPSSKGSISMIVPKQVLKHKLYNKVAHGPHWCCTAFSLPACIYGLMGCSLQSFGRGRKTWARFTFNSAQYAGTTSKWTSVSLYFLSRREIVGRTLSSAHGCSFVWNEKWWLKELPIHGCGKWLGWVIRDFEGTWLKSWWQGNLEEGDVDRLYRMGKAWTYLCPMWEFTKGWPQKRT